MTFTVQLFSPPVHSRLKNISIKGVSTMKRFLLVITLFMLAGCGDVDWFPEAGSGDPSLAPDTFTFQRETSTLTEATNETTSLSESKTVTGTNSAGWTVSVTDSTTGAESEFSVANDLFSSTPRVILPNQNLQIRHLPAKVVGGQSTTIVRVGTFQTTFTTETIADAP